jgi:hypothetical protein
MTITFSNKTVSNGWVCSQSLTHKDAEPVLIWQIEDILSIGGCHAIIWKARVWTIMGATVYAWRLEWHTPCTVKIFSVDLEKRVGACIVLLLFSDTYFCYFQTPTFVIFRHPTIVIFRHLLLLFSDSYFSEDKWYKYTYTSTVESSFVGTSPSKSGFKYTCDLTLGIFTKFQSVLKVC